MNGKTRLQGSVEETLVRRAAQGDLDAFNQLVLQYQDMLYNHTYSLLGDPAAAEDAAQESFIKAFQGLASFRGGSFRGWLLQISTNAAYDILRKTKRHPSQPLFPDDENGDEVESPAWIADPTASVQSTVEQNELTKSIHKALKKLPDKYRTVITLVDMYELDYTEAARLLNVPIGTIKSRLARGRLQMQENLKANSPREKRFNMAVMSCAA